MAGVMAVLPPVMDWAVHLRVPPVRVQLPILSTQCLAPPSCPATVRRDVPFQSLAQSSSAERFNLVVPTSLVEKNFDILSVLQRGLTVVFRTAASSNPVHCRVTRHTNPLGLTTYRVAGQQPAGVAPGCALLGWSTADGCLVAELGVRQPTTTSQAAAPPPAPRLFADCLPSPATVKKQPRPQQPERELDSSPAPQLQPQPQQLSCFTAPFAQVSHDQPQQLICQLPLPSLPLPCGGVRPAAAAAAVPSVDAGPRSQPLLTSFASDPLPLAAAAPHSRCGGLPPVPSSQRPADGARQPAAEVPPCGGHAGIVTRSMRLSGKAASVGGAAAGREPHCQRPGKRAATCPPSPRGSGGEGDACAGIDLLLAAHATLSQEQEQRQLPEGGRPKRVRVQKRLSLP